MSDAPVNERDIGLERVMAVKRAYEADLMSKPNVIGVGVGYRAQEGAPTNELAIIVSVVNKLAANELDPDDVIPSELEGVPVDVQETGVISAGGEG